ncbi:MAG TPA: hypothetical protein VMZ90_01135 [Vicinamibacterales bacterium]|nr:hypothetical protein [Vicinamibacterales bacterium]
MTVLDVFVNDRKMCRAGVGRDGVLTAIVNWVKLTGEAAGTARRLDQPGEEMRLHVGGLRKDTHLSWVEQQLKVGDRVSVVVGRSRVADLPAREKRRDPKQEERQQRAYYLRLKEQFELPRRSPSARPADSATTQFLNVDLDLRSRSSLEPLVKAFGRKILVLHCGREGREYGAHLELGLSYDNPDLLLRRFVALVEALPRPARALWNRARVREFNIGIQSATKPQSFDLHLKDATVRAVARVNARIGMTVYGAAR